jgi:hypothetical protein
MQSLHAQHTDGVPSSPALAIPLTNVSCDSCLLHKATVAPRNTVACVKPSRPLLHMSSSLWGPVYSCPLPTWPPLLHARHRPPYPLHVGAVPLVKGRRML